MENEARDLILDERQTFVSGDPVPRRSLLLASVFAHAAALILMVVVWHASRVQILPQKFATVIPVSGAANLVFSPPSVSPAQPRLSLPQKPHAARRWRMVSPNSQGNGDSATIVREQAKQQTAAIMLSLRFLTTYGFSPGHKYQLAFQTAGQMPFIPATDLPPRFEQYVTVEVTIDTAGHVADARIVGGEVTTIVQQKLLSAVRQFRYTPATRDGIPIPSQLDLVVHIPS